MKNFLPGNTYKKFVLTVAFLLGVGVATVVHAESGLSTSKSRVTTATNLSGLIQSIGSRQIRIDEIHAINRDSGTDPTVALQIELENLSTEVVSLQRTFSQLSTGGIEVVEVGTENEEFDWRKEIILVTQPLLENLKGLTEKPRKIERLKTIINQREEETIEIQNALDNLGGNLQLYPEGDTRTALLGLEKDWLQRQTENLQSLELNRFQLATLQGDNTPRIDTIKKIVFDFLNGRGLTIGLAVLVSLVLWLLTRGLLWLMLRKKQREAGRSRLVRHRLASYGYSFFTTLLIVIGVMVVLYIRGDLLLLALSIVVFVSIALSLRTILPQFASEARLLLNIGSIREGERVIYEGLPYEVKSINVHSYLRNPCLAGVIRLPLSSLKDMTSRPSANEEWFPCRVGDALLLNDGNLMEVISQTPEFVELKNRAGALSHIPTTDFISQHFDNLTRSGKFRVFTTFGVDYQLQDISLDVIPEAMERHIKLLFSQAPYAQNVLDVRAEFKVANSCSLDYVLFVELHSDAALAKNKAERLIQRACVEVCTREGWNIPYPQLTVHQSEIPEDSTSGSTDEQPSLRAFGT